LLPNAIDFEEALAQGTPELPVSVTPDDLHIIYTGGTTGMPKAVLWRQHDIFLSAMGGQLPRYQRDARPGRAMLPSSWWHRYEQFGRPIPIEYADEAAFRRWRATTPAPWWPGPTPRPSWSYTAPPTR
jgi:acyl-CoA synthetase (AMP-forming)/AMP-acid ligase II